MRTIAIAAALCLFAGAAQAQADRPPWWGVWQGTVGEAKVRACFGRDSDPDAGLYYYLRHRQLIVLTTATQSPPTWVENDDKTAPRWTLVASGRNSLTGTWHGGGRSLPIRLTRVPVDKPSEEEADDTCGSFAFTAPRLPATTVTRTPATIDGVAYTKLIVKPGAPLDVSIETFALDATTPAAARLNGALAKGLPNGGASNEVGYRQCLMWSASSGADGQYDDALKPEIISQRWMVTKESNDSSCGGAHPNSEIDWRVWDLASGGPVDAWSWFADDAKVVDALIARWPRKDECKDVAQGQSSWDVHPTRTGLAFWPQLPHVAFACSQDVVISYRDIAPMLNAKGRAAIASIVEDLKALPPR